MTPRAYAELALIVISGAASWGYVQERDGRLRAEGRLEPAIARADSSAQIAREATAAAARADSALARTERRADSLDAEGRRRAAAAGARIPPARDSVRAAAARADSAAVRVRLDELEALHADREAGLLQRIAADSITIAGLRASKVTDGAAIAALEKALADEQAARMMALQARPGWLERNVLKVATVAAFVLGWFAHDTLD